MRSFKEFLEQEARLFLEEDGDHNDQFGYQLIYPVYADEGKWALNDPVSMYFFQWAIDRGLKKHGRELHNIDNKQLQSIRFKSLKSITAPEAGDGFWEHRPDDRPNLVTTDEDELVPLGQGKDSKHPKIVQWDHPSPGGREFNQGRHKDFPSSL